MPRVPIEGSSRPQMTPEEAKAAIAFLNETADMLYGEGAHAGHEQRQVGRCVACSCGMRVQGRLPTREQRKRHRGE
jgi:hypothetical protein